MRTKELQDRYPFPWKHCGRGRMSAVVAANGSVVAGSSICMQSDVGLAAIRQSHALISMLANDWHKETTAVRSTAKKTPFPKTEKKEKEAVIRMLGKFRPNKEVLRILGESKPNGKGKDK